MPTVRSALSFLASFLVHVGTLAAALYWLPARAPFNFELAAGRARMLEAAMPSVAREAAPEVSEVSVEIVVKEPLKTPVERKPPSAQERPEVVVERATEMLPVPPESRAPRDDKHQPETAQVAKVLPKQATKPPSPVSTTAAPAFVAVIDPGAKVDVPRETTSNLPPHYPADELARGVEGVVKVRIWVAAEGHVTRTAVEESSGSAALDASALAAVARWKFHPAMRGGRPTAHEIIKPVRFTIRKK